MAGADGRTGAVKTYNPEGLTVVTWGGNLAKTCSALQIGGVFMAEQRTGIEMISSLVTRAARSHHTAALL